MTDVENSAFGTEPPSMVVKGTMDMADGAAAMSTHPHHSFSENKLPSSRITTVKKP